MAIEAHRRPYQITAAGQSVLTEQLQSMGDIARVGHSRIMPAGPPRITPAGQSRAALA